MTLLGLDRSMASRAFVVFSTLAIVMIGLLIFFPTEDPALVGTFTLVLVVSFATAAIAFFQAFPGNPAGVLSTIPDPQPLPKGDAPARRPGPGKIIAGVILVVLALAFGLPHYEYMQDAKDANAAIESCSVTPGCGPLPGYPSLTDQHAQNQAVIEQRRGFVLTAVGAGLSGVVLTIIGIVQVSRAPIPTPKPIAAASEAIELVEWASDACADCRAPVSPTDTFCGKCGRKLAAVCSGCERVLDPSDKFCRGCGRAASGA